MEDKDKLTELFESISSEILTEEVKLQLGVLFEEAINSAIKVKEQELQEAHDAKVLELEESQKAKEAALDESNATDIATFKEELVEQMDEYLDYFCKEYIKENEQVVEDYAKVKLAEKVLRNFKQMTEAFNISLSEESVSSEDEIAELQTENSKLVNQLIESRKEVETVTKAALISEASAALDTDIQREKLVEMAKNIEYDAELFESKLGVLVDTIKAKAEVEAEEVVTESLEVKPEEVAPAKVVNEKIAAILKAF